MGEHDHHGDDGIRQGRAPVVALLEARRSDELANLARRRGLQPYHAPAMREEPLPDEPAVAHFIDQLEGGDIAVVILLTGVGTTALLQAAESLGRRRTLREALARVTVVARGPKPVAALRAASLQPDVVAATPYTTATVLEAVDALDLRGRGVAVQLAGEPNAGLRQGLEERGARVEELALYRWAAPEDEGPIERLLDDLAAGRIDAVLVTSSPQVHNLFAVAARHGGADALRRSLRTSLVASVGPVCSGTLRTYGVDADIEATPPKMGPLVAAVATALESRQDIDSGTLQP